jgi:O-acetyl-ADP-ribose deacetylase (regulator of RNase III)
MIMVNPKSRYSPSIEPEQRRILIGDTVLELVQGDIIYENVDAIVNAANSSLMGGGGVDGAIHRAAGPELLEETQKLKGCRTGNAKITAGYRLNAKHIIHAVGPIYQHNNPEVPKLLASAYRRSLEIAIEHNLKSIAFSAISTGVYGYPMDEASEIALSTVIETLSNNHNALETVRFVLFTPEALETFTATLDALAEKHALTQVD